MFSLLRLSTRQGRFVNWLQTYLRLPASGPPKPAHPRQTVFCALGFEAVGPRFALDLKSTSYLPKNRPVRSPILRLSSLNPQLSHSPERVPLHRPRCPCSSHCAIQFVSLPASRLCSPTAVRLPGTEKSLSNLHLVSAQLLILPRHWGPGLLAGWKSLLDISFLSFCLSSVPLSNLTHFSLTGTVLRTHTCHHTQSFQTRPPPCFPGLSTSLPKGPNYHPPLQLPKQLEASLHSLGLSFCFASAIILSYLSMATASTWSLLLSSPCS